MGTRALFAGLVLTGVASACGGKGGVLPPVPPGGTGPSIVSDVVTVDPIPATGAASPVTIDEYSVEKLPSSGGIAVASDGSVWWESPGSAQPVLVRMQGAQVRTLTIGMSDGYVGEELMASSENGRVWAGVARAQGYSSFGNPQFSQYIVYATSSGSAAQPAGGMSLDPETVTDYGALSSLFYGPSGDVWWAISANQTSYPAASLFGSVAQNAVSASHTNMSTYDSPGGYESQFFAGLAGPDGAVWIAALSLLDDEISFDRFSPDGTLVGSIPLPNIRDVTDAVSGPDGAVWFTDFTQNLIGRVSTAGAMTTYALPSGEGPWDITVGGDGALWFTDSPSGPGASLGRITTGGNISMYPLPTSDAGPQEIVGPQTSPGCNPAQLWLSEANSGKVVEIAIKT